MADKLLTKRLNRSKPITPDFFCNTIGPSGSTATKFITICGPMSIYRFGRINFGESQRWFTEELFKEATEVARKSTLNGGHYGNTIREYIREKTAVCLDWNDFTSFNAMHIPSNVKIPAFTSIIKDQPIVSEKEIDRAGKSKKGITLSSFSGGAYQLWLFPVPDWIDIKPDFLKTNIGL